VSTQQNLTGSEWIPVAGCYDYVNVVPRYLFLGISLPGEQMLHSEKKNLIFTIIKLQNISTF